MNELTENQQRSLLLLAAQKGLNPHEIKSGFMNELIGNKVGVKGAKEFISSLNQRIQEEAVALKIDPHDTPAFVLSLWAKEYIVSEIFKDRKRTKEEVTKDFLELHPELGTEDKEKFLSANPSIVSLWLHELDNAEYPCLNYHDRANSKIREEDYMSALKFIERGLELAPKEFVHLFLQERAECYAKLKRIEDACKDLESAIEIITVNDPSDDFTISGIRKDLAYLRLHQRWKY
jgi:tetratricopeptide (TPR) repeat protein